MKTSFSFIRLSWNIRRSDVSHWTRVILFKSHRFSLVLNCERPRMFQRQQLKGGEHAWRSLHQKDVQTVSHTCFVIVQRPRRKVYFFPIDRIEWWRDRIGSPNYLRGSSYWNRPQFVSFSIEASCCNQMFYHRSALVEESSMCAIDYLYPTIKLMHACTLNILKCLMSLAESR